MDLNKIATKTFLYFKASDGNAFAKLIDITSYPSPNPLGDMVDVSDMSSEIKKYTEGMKDVGGQGMQFGFIYDKTSYEAAATLDNTPGSYQIRFGENGEYGAWEWEGTHVTRLEGASVGDVRTGTITCFPTTDIEETTITTL